MCAAEHVDEREKTDTWTRVLFLCAISLILASLAILTRSGPATGYERSIYGGYPDSLWAILIASFFVGQIIILRSAYSQSTSRSWILGLVAILLVNWILLSLPVIRGYPINGRDDVLTQIGWTKDILQNGFTGESDFYAIDHLLIAELAYLSGINLMALTYVIPFSFSFYYILAFYLLARQLLGTRSMILISVAFSSVLMFGFNNTAYIPFGQSLAMLPILLYIYLKSGELSHKKMTLVLMPMIVMMVFFHPLTAMVLIVVMMTHYLVFRSVAREHIKRGGIAAGVVRFSPHLTAFAIVVFFAWQLYPVVVVSQVKGAFGWLWGEPLKSDLQTYLSAFGKARPSLTESISVTMYTYGQFLTLSILSVVAILKSVSRTKRAKSKDSFDSFSEVVFLVFALLSAFLLISGSTFGMTRILKAAAPFSCILGASLLSLMLIQGRTKSRLNRRVRLAFVGLALLSTLYFSTFNLYLSPTILDSNQQVPESDFTGMEYFFEVRDTYTPTLELGLHQFRFHDAIQGTDAPNDDLIYRGSGTPIDHFGYPVNATLGASYEGGTYLLLDDLGRNLYQYLYPNYENYRPYWKFLPEDFDRLQNDTTVDMLFTNGNLEFFYVG
jgi:hypothetical protein